MAPRTKRCGKPPQEVQRSRVNGTLFLNSRFGLVTNGGSTIQRTALLGTEHKSHERDVLRRVALSDRSWHMLQHSPGSADGERDNVAAAMSAKLSLVERPVHANL